MVLSQALVREIENRPLLRDNLYFWCLVNRQRLQVPDDVLFRINLDLCAKHLIESLLLNILLLQIFCVLRYCEPVMPFRFASRDWRLVRQGPDHSIGCEATQILFRSVGRFCGHGHPKKGRLNASVEDFVNVLIDWHSGRIRVFSRSRGTFPSGR